MRSAGSGKAPGGFRRGTTDSRRRSEHGHHSGRVGAGREVALLSVSIDLGAGRRGVDMGPSALRIAGVTEAIEALGYRLREMGTVHAPGPEGLAEGEPGAKFLDEIAQVCARSRELVMEALDAGSFRSCWAGTTP
jgi:arginase family enzyme